MPCKLKSPAMAGLFLVLLGKCHAIARRASSLRVDDADELPVLRTFALKLHEAVFFREQCVVTTQTNIDSRMNARAALTNNDVSSNDRLAAENLHA